MHYYFRTKERLFEAIFTEIIKFAFPQLTQIIQSDIPMVTKIEQVIDAYIAILIKHPFVPGFIMKELNRDPSGLFKLVLKFKLNPQIVFDQIQEAMDRGEIIRMKPQHLVVNVVSMCIFPFVARPVLNFVVFKEDSKALEEFYAERATVIKRFVINAIVINNR